MNPKLRVNQSIFLILYLKYKAYMPSFGVITVCIGVFLFFIMPQVQLYFSTRSEVVADQQTIQILNDNLSMIATIKQDEVAKNLSIAVAALPAQKDYAGILNAISRAATVANVGLGDYSFQIGDIFDKNAANNKDELTLQITLSLTSDLVGTKRFTDILAKEFPLSEITAINSRGEGGSEVRALFFYNPLPPSQFVPTIPLPKLSIPQQKLLKSLASDYSSPIDIAIPLKNASSSAQ